MNRRLSTLVLTVFALTGATSSAFAQPETGSSAPKSVTAPSAASSKAPARSNIAPLGSWKSTQAPQGTLTGRIVLHADGRAVLAADGQPELNGRWTIPAPGQLSFDMPPHGVAQMRFEQPKPSVLVLTYENGTRQTFNKEAPSK